MEVKIVLAPEFITPVAEIRAQEITPTIEKVVAYIEQEQVEKVTILKGKELVVLEKHAIVLVRTEVKKVVVYEQDGMWHETNQTLAELEQILGEGFVRISKSAIVNLNAVASVKAAFSGTLELLLSNGIEESISRIYRKQFKSKLEAWFV